MLHLTFPNIKEKKCLLILISSLFMVFVVILSIFLFSRGYSDFGDTGNKQIYHIADANNGFEIFYDPLAMKSVKEYYESGTVVINGSYFGKTDSGTYYPAGKWMGINRYTGYMESFGDRIENPDPNLSHIVKVRKDNQGVFIVPNFLAENPLLYFSGAETWGNPEKWENIEISNTFQAGPLVLSGNILQSFGDSWHAGESHERTLIGKTQSGKVYFFVFEKPVTLREAGEKILTDNRFALDPLTLLNLDGGPSTAYYDGKKGFRENEKLPIIFRIASF